MYRFFHFLAIIIASSAVFSANANECTSYKIQPKIVINTPTWTRSVIMSRAPMNLLHGNVAATMINDYEVVADVIPVDDGYCVGLKEINATIGYSDFLIKIDNRHTPKSCSYNAIVNHEDKHIAAYLSVVEDNSKEIHEALYSAANSIMPVFVKKQSDINDAIEKLNDELQSHPDTILMVQKLHAAEEINNKAIDQHEDYSELKKCIE